MHVNNVKVNRLVNLFDFLLLIIPGSEVTIRVFRVWRGVEKKMKKFPDFYTVQWRKKISFSGALM